MVDKACSEDEDFSLMSRDASNANIDDIQIVHDIKKSDVSVLLRAGSLQELLQEALSRSWADCDELKSIVAHLKEENEKLRGENEALKSAVNSSLGTCAASSPHLRSVESVSNTLQKDPVIKAGTYSGSGTDYPLDVGLQEYGCLCCSGSSVRHKDQIIVKSRGRDIWDTKDLFHFCREPLPLNNDSFNITAHLTSWACPCEWSKAGIMVRNGLDASAAYFFMMVPGAHDPVIQYRASKGAFAEMLDEPCSWNTHPKDVWLKVEKRGNSLHGYYRLTSNHEWQKAGSMTFDWANSSEGEIHIGLAVTSNTCGGGEATAVFENFTIGSE